MLVPERPRPLADRFMGRLRDIKLEWVLLVATLLLAAWLRFNGLDQVEFRWDQAEISKWALNMATQRRVTWIGTWSSTRLDTFPVAIWLFAIPYALSPNPILASGFVAALNLAAIVACYFLARRWFGRTAALVATLLFAVAPWAVIYSRKVWHTVLFPPFVLLYVATGWAAFVRGRRWALLAHTLALATLVQIHFSALPLVPLTVLWALLFCRRLDWRVVTVSALLAAITFVPYFAIDAQNDWRNVRLFAELMAVPSLVNGDAARAAWELASGSNLRLLTGPERYADFVAGTINPRWLFVAGGGLALGGSLLALWRIARRARRGIDDETAAALMALTWLAVPILFFTRHNVEVASHYLTITLPAPFILAGWVVAQAGGLRRGGRFAQAALLALALLLAGAQGYETAALLRFVATHDVPGYGTPIHYELGAAQTVARLEEEAGATETILLSEGDEPRMYEMPAVADVLLWGQPHRAVDVQTALLFPAHPAVYWVTRDTTPGEVLLASLVPEVIEARIPLREGAHSFRFYRWPGGEPNLDGMQPPPQGQLTWANGVQLVGYRLEGDLQPGSSVHWTLVWRPTNMPTEDVNYHWFNHLLDREGQMVGQSDGPSLLPANWRAGDTVVNWFYFEVPPDAPPGGYIMRVGMYTYPAIENVPLQDGNGEWAEIELP